MLIFLFGTVGVVMATRMVMVMVMLVVIVPVIVFVMVSVMPVSMAMRMSVVRMSAHCYHAEQIDEQSQSTDQKELIGVHLWGIQPEKGILAQTALRGLHPRAHRRCMASNMMKIEIRIRKMPFAKPESVSIRPYLK